MWIILFNAVDEFGVREHNEANRSGSPVSMAPKHVQIENIKRKISDEALHGALRISGLVSPPYPVSRQNAVSIHILPQAGVLTSNGYLVKILLFLPMLHP